jgi:hypothetical protein
VNLSVMVAVRIMMIRDGWEKVNCGHTIDLIEPFSFQPNFRSSFSSALGLLRDLRLLFLSVINQRLIRLHFRPKDSSFRSNIPLARPVLHINKKKVQYFSCHQPSDSRPRSRPDTRPPKRHGESVSRGSVLQPHIFVLTKWARNKSNQNLEKKNGRW